MPCSLHVQGADAVGLDGASTLVQGSGSSTPHPSGYMTAGETVPPVGKKTSTAGPQQSSSALTGAVGNNT